MITIDTSAVVALLDARDQDHDRVREALAADAGPYLLPIGILAEITYFIERRIGQKVLDAFLASVEMGDLALDCGEQDLARIRWLVNRYADLPLSFADAAVMACAERHGGRVLTLDLRHFGVAAREVSLILLP